MYRAYSKIISLVAIFCPLLQFSLASAENAVQTKDLSASSANVIKIFNYRILDAEYSKSLDRIISISESPNQLHIYDPESEQEVSVGLPKIPNCVSIGPDGHYAVVGHDAWISYIDLRTASLISTLPVQTDVLDIVLAGNGFAYAFPREDQWEKIHCINLSSGEETTNEGYSIYAGTLAKLHPGGKAIYGADNGLSPSDIEKYNIEGGTAVYLYDSPYHGDYPTCGDLWMSEDGLRIFTRCGNVFMASDSQSQDMTYNGSLSQTQRVQWAEHSIAAQKILVIPANQLYPPADNDTNLHIYGYEYLSFETSTPLPSFPLNETSYAGHGRFVFFNSSGSRYYIVLQADENSGMLYDYGIAKYSTDSLIPEDRTENLYFAQFANGIGFVSRLTLTNPSAVETAIGTVSFFNDAGNPLSFSLNGQPFAQNTPIAISPLGSLTLSTDGLGELVVGSARVSASLQLGGVLRFLYPGLGIGGVSSSMPASGFITPVTRNAAQNRNTGIVFAAVNSEADIDLVLRNQNGDIMSGGQTTIQLAANGHLARFLDELFPEADTDEFEGVVTAIAADSVLIVGAVFEIGSNPGEFTTMPVTPLH